MSGSITREEFAEVAVKLYELYTGKKAEPAPSSTFTDTTNSEILKAYQLGIVSGIGNNIFAPKATSTREQAVIVAVRVYETYAGLTE
jgi:hypothetical protein